MTTEPNLRLLVIDDNRAIHDDFRKVLCGAAADDLDAAEARMFGAAPDAEGKPGFEIDSAFQGEEGVAMLRAAHEAGRPYALAFVDVRMPPGIDGIETVARLWALDPDLQVVICTAYSDYSWQEMIGRLGRSDRLLILKKPFDVTEVLQLASALTEKWRLARQSRWQFEAVTELVEARTAELRKANEELQAEITHRELMETQLLRAQRLESIGTLTGGIAHNLNNMLTPILMGVPSLLAERPRAVRERIVHSINASAQRAADIVRQLLTFARGVEGEHTPLDAGYLVREAAKIAGDTFPQTISIQAPPTENLALVEADSTQVHQILMNLCLNARDAMPDGGVLKIEAANFEVDENYAGMNPEARVGEYVVLRVSDTGIGIPHDVFDRIFDPFFTTKPLDKGCGLGLSTVAGLVRGHHGFINVSSRVGKGSTFEIFLPALTKTSAPATEPRPLEPPQGRGELVLVVDDEIGIREVITAILAESGYQTLAAADGAEALKLYGERGGEIDVVLTDILMPFLDGVELCRDLRKINPQVRVIASTGEAHESKFAQLRAMGVKSFLTKPYSTERLLVTLREALGECDAAFPVRV
jgi:signal transduction histidine kinase